MRKEVTEFLLKVCDAANIPGTHAEIMAEAKQSLKQSLQEGSGLAPVRRSFHPPQDESEASDILGR